MAENLEARVARVEHAAHCIGYVLSGIYGSYTKCPHHHLITEAHNRIQLLHTFP